MATSGPGSYGPAYGSSYSVRNESREPGARRKKLAEALKAANEVRKTYFGGDDVSDIAGHHADHGQHDFPHAAVVRGGSQEMILFPSYARRHVKNKPISVQTPSQEMTEEEYWRRQWEKESQKNAVVDVDVRGWVYAPQRGPMTRKHRLMIGLARQLSSIPAPTTRPNEPTNPSNMGPGRGLGVSEQDEDLIAAEAENIVKNGQREERIADQGAFSERPGKFAESDDINNGTNAIDFADEPSSVQLKSRTSWPPPAKMTSAELATANAHLLTRLKPFMANPRADTIVKAFFYNDVASREHIVSTDPSGHFTFRSTLDFVPTHVRVVAGEDMRLAATEEVTVTAPHGVSLISDIDDTIKHSAISAGAREIFRNAFIRDLSELTIEGVREWYNTLQDMGVKLHYVSNSPWQMYPVLTSFFKLAHLPKGSFHLKQYTGMLQGIFEPVAERKKSSLDKIMRDFPDRKFILVGDSGEADLEVYTDVAVDNPGRILGIFIRDVTTPFRSGYFDPSYSPAVDGPIRSRNLSRPKSGDALAMSKRLSRPQDIRDDDVELRAAIAASLEDMEEETRRARQSINPDSFSEPPRSHETGPRLPPRPPAPRKGAGHGVQTTKPDEDLIDLSDPMPSRSWPTPSPQDSDLLNNPARAGIEQKSSPSPAPPPKPAKLRSPSPNTEQTSSVQHSGKPPPPPPPRKPSTLISAAPISSRVAQMKSHELSPLSQITRQESTAKPRPPLPARRSYREFAKEKISKALPTSNNVWQADVPIGSPRPKTASNSRVNSTPTSPLSRPMSTAKSFEDLKLPEASLPPSPRRNFSGYSLSPRRYSHARSASWDEESMGSPGEGISKKEYLWKQRVARAQSLLERNGVTFRTWRVGADVAHICVKLVEMELKDIERRQGKSGRQ